MNFTEQEVFEQIGRLFMSNLKLGQENQALREALAEDEDDDAEKA